MGSGTGRRVHLRRRRISGFVLAIVGVGLWLVLNPASYQQEVVQSTGGRSTASGTGANGQGADDSTGAAGQGTAGQSANAAGQGSNAASQSPNTTGQNSDSAPLATTILSQLEIKGRAPKTGYARTEFYNNWPNVDGCSLRQVIIKRELGSSAVLDGCDVVAGEFTEPYTGSTMVFYQKSDFSSKIQIDHVVALSDAWQTGAQYLGSDARYQMATDPLNLLAVDSSANQKKSDGDAATWLPPNKAFRCQYVARQVSVKYKYHLWVTQAEYDAIAGVLEACPSEPAVGV